MEVVGDARRAVNGAEITAPGQRPACVLARAVGDRCAATRCTNALSPWRTQARHGRERGPASALLVPSSAVSHRSQEGANRDCGTRHAPSESAGERLSRSKAGSRPSGLRSSHGTRHSDRRLPGAQRLYGPRSHGWRHDRTFRRRGHLPRWSQLGLGDGRDHSSHASVRAWPTGRERSETRHYAQGLRCVSTTKDH